MNIRQKMLLGAGLLTLIPVALTAALLWQNASTVAAAAVTKQTQDQLVSLRDTKIVQLRAELQSRLKALQTVAAQRSTAEAMRSFKPAFATAAKDFKTDVAAESQVMTAYVDKQFNAEFANRNPNAAPALAELLARRDPATVALQAAYITSNANPLGQKDKLAAAPEDTPYNRAHAAFHPGFERAQKLEGFYDIFLIDVETDTVVYSVFKELDFATRLSDGIAAKTKLDEAYRAVKAAKSKDDAYLSDYAQYLPSYNDQAAFAAVPIFDGDKQIGVMAMQYPIDTLTDAANSNKSWSQIGLGETGDVFLVGAQDKRMRTNARYLSEANTKAAFLEQVRGKLSAADAANLAKKDTTIGSVIIDSEATQAGAAGQSGVLEYTDYRGIRAIGAYAPLKFLGLNWVMVTKIDAAEAQAPIRALNQSTLLRAALVALGVVLVAAVLVSVFLSRFMKPIQTLTETVQAVSKGNIDARSKLTEQDEIGELGRQFDTLLDERIASLEKASRENETLNNSVIALLQAVFQLSNRDLTARAPVTEDIIGTVSSSINQFSEETARTLTDVQGVADQVQQISAAVREQSELLSKTAAAEAASVEQMTSTLNATTQQLVQVAALSDTSNAAAQQTARATEAALTAVQATVQGMDALRESISEMEKRFKRLGERSQEISSAVNLINTISERTHVLALNASMQAATAGEAGRGFAVVAEEVQRLSDSSRQATGQIAQLVGNIQAETNETLFTVNRLIGEVVKQSDSAQRAGAQMTQTQAATQQLVGLVNQIAAFSTQQTELANSLRAAVADINEGTERTQTVVGQQTQSTQTLADYAQRLATSVAQFKLS